MINIIKFLVLSGSVFMAVFLSTATNAAGEVTCTNGDVTGLANGDYCFTAPTYYGVTVYEMGVCTSIPTAPTTTSTAGLSNCEVVFQSNAGALVEVQNGVTSSLSGTISRPPNGTYTYAYLRMNNTFLIRGSVDFGASHATVTNRYCTSITATTDNESGAAVTTGSCSATAGATPGLVSTELTDFDGSSQSNLTAYTIGNLTAYLLNASQHLADSTETTQAGAAGIMGVQRFTSPVIFTDDTTTMDAALTVSKGMTVSVNGVNTVGFDSGPFVMTLTVQ